MKLRLSWLSWVFPLSTALPSSTHRPTAPTPLFLSVTFTHFQQRALPGASVLFQKKHDCIIVPLPEPPPVIPQLNTHPGIACAIKQKQYCTFLCTVCTVSSSGFLVRRDQKLKRLIKSWGERDMVQLSGLLAVQGWFVSCQKKKKIKKHTTINTIFFSVLSSKCSFTFSFISTLIKCKVKREKNTLPSRTGCGSVCKSAGCHCIALCEGSSGSA